MFQMNQKYYKESFKNFIKEKWEFPNLSTAEIVKFY